MSNNNFNQLLNRMLDNIEVRVHKNEGSVLREIISALALELEQAYLSLENFKENSFAMTAKGQYLTSKAKEFGIERDLGAFSRGRVKIKGNQNAAIKEGDIVYTESGLEYEILEAVVLGEVGEVTVEIKAVRRGTDYNLPANSNFDSDILGVSEITSEEEIAGGTNQETDDDLREKLFFEIQNATFSGNSAHYKVWAENVEGVGLARVFPTFHGPGTVRVVIIDNERQPATVYLRDAVMEEIESEMPIGANLSVESAIPILINIEVKLILTNDGDLNVIKTQIEEKIEELLKEVAFNEDFISYAKVGQEIINIEEVADYEDLKINGTFGNIQLEEDEVAILEEVDVYEG